MLISNEGYVQRLNELIVKKIKCLSDILTLTQKQTNAINEDGVDLLASIVDDKQKIIDEADKLDEQFQVYFQGLKRSLKIQKLEEMGNIGIKGIKELQTYIGEIRSLAREISEIENKNYEMAKNLLNEFGTEIKKLNQGKKLNTTYYPRPVRSTSHFIDQKK